jgi:hypothetical protein
MASKSKKATAKQASAKKQTAKTVTAKRKTRKAVQEPEAAPVQEPEVDPAPAKVEKVKRPSLLGRMYELVQEATEGNPVSKADVEAALTVEFPDHKPPKETVAAYLTPAESAKRGLTLHSTTDRPKRYWATTMQGAE